MALVMQTGSERQTEILLLTESHSLPCSLFPERQKSQCERHRESAQAAAPTSGLLAFLRPRPVLGQYVPQCDAHGAYESTQCHASISQCWCVDANGREIPNTRSGPGSAPLCESRDHASVTPALAVGIS